MCLIFLKYFANMYISIYVEKNSYKYTKYKNTKGNDKKIYRKYSTGIISGTQNTNKIKAKCCLSFWPSRV